MYTFHVDGTKPPVDDTWLFVFGSNLAGIHGAGAAREARETYGAMPGIGMGRMGHSFAIPTKNENIITRPLEDIAFYVQEVFLPYAQKQARKKFFITRIGCGLAGYKDEQIAPMFVGAPTNCDFPEEWGPHLEQASAAVMLAYFKGDMTDAEWEAYLAEK